MGKALLVVDMQNVCVGKDHAKMFRYDGEELIRSVNEVIDGYRPNEVYYIQNAMKKNFMSRLMPFSAYEGSYEVELVQGLRVVNRNLYVKYKGNAFTNEVFAKDLRDAGVTEVAIVGLDGGGCVARTALGACEEGYSVTLVTRAIGTMMVRRAERLNRKLRNRKVIFA